jgi:hypothetical protein
VALALIVAGGAYLLVTRGSARERVYAPRPVVPNTDHDATAALAVATADLPDADDDLDGVDGDDVAEPEPAPRDAEPER